jgi:hypothetical protein
VRVQEYDGIHVGGGIDHGVLVSFIGHSPRLVRPCWKDPACNGPGLPCVVPSYYDGCGGAWASGPLDGVILLTWNKYRRAGCVVLYYYPFLGCFRGSK